MTEIACSGDPAGVHRRDAGVDVPRLAWHGAEQRAADDDVGGVARATSERTGRRDRTADPAGTTCVWTSMTGELEVTAPPFRRPTLASISRCGQHIDIELRSEPAPLEGGTVAVVSLSDPDFLVDPYPAITEHRPEGVVPNTDQGGWWVLDSETIWRLIRDPNSASDPEKADPDAPITKVFKQARLSMFYMDPPDHTRIRGSVKVDFTPARGQWPRADDRRHDGGRPRRAPRLGPHRHRGRLR